MISKSYKEYDDERLSSELEAILRDLAIQLFRTSAGAGKSHQLADIMRYYLTYFDELSTRGKPVPDPDNLREVLDFRVKTELLTKNSDDARMEWKDHCIDNIVKGSLRLAASRLARSHLQEVKSRQQIVDGISDFQAADDEIVRQNKMRGKNTIKNEHL